MEKNKIQKNFNKFLSTERLTVSSFCSNTGLGKPQKVYNFLKGKTRISAELIIAIIKYYPDLNIRWLILNEGPMYVSVSKYQEMEEKLSEVKEMIKHYKTIVNSYRNEKKKSASDPDEH